MRLPGAKEFMMKKILAVLCLVLAGVGLFAAGSRDTVTVEGKLAVTDSVPSITANGKTWVLPEGPFYRVAWENGIKIGDTLKVEGFEMECRNDGPDAGLNAGSVLLMPSKLWVNGKEIDLSKYAGRNGPGGMGGPARGMMTDDNGRGRQGCR